MNFLLFGTLRSAILGGMITHMGHAHLSFEHFLKDTLYILQTVNLLSNSQYKRLLGNQIEVTVSILQSILCMLVRICGVKFQLYPYMYCFYVHPYAFVYRCRLFSFESSLRVRKLWSAPFKSQNIALFVKFYNQV